MIDFLSKLRLPGTSTDELLESLLRLAVFLAVGVAAAWAVGPAFARWQRRSVASGPDVDRLVGALRSFVVIFALYEGVASLPLSLRAATFATGALFVMTVLVAARIVVRAARVAIRGYLDRTADGAVREHAQREYLPIASTATTVGVTLIALAVVAHHFGHDVSSVVTALGVSSLAIGLAAQATLGNTIAGFILLIDRPFRPGDRIRLQSGEVGEVAEVGIRSTSILVPEGNLLIVPNAELANTRVLNLSAPDGRTRGEVRITVDIGMLDRVLPLLAQVAAGAASQSVARVRAAGDVAEAGGEELRVPAQVVVVSIEARVVVLALRFDVQVGQRLRVEDWLRGELAAQLQPLWLKP